MDEKVDKWIYRFSRKSSDIWYIYNMQYTILIIYATQQNKKSKTCCSSFVLVFKHMEDKHEKLTHGFDVIYKECMQAILSEFFWC